MLQDYSVMAENCEEKWNVFALNKVIITVIFNQLILPQGPPSQLNNAFYAHLSAQFVLMRK